MNFFKKKPNKERNIKIMQLSATIATPLFALTQTFLKKIII